MITVSRTAAVTRTDFFADRAWSALPIVEDDLYKTGGRPGLGEQLTPGILLIHREQDRAIA